MKLGVCETVSEYEAFSFGALLAGAGETDARIIIFQGSEPTPKKKPELPVCSLPTEQE